MSKKDAQALKQGLIEIITERCTNQLAGEIAGYALQHAIDSPIRIAFGMQSAVIVSADLKSVEIWNLGITLRKIGGQDD